MKKILTLALCFAAVGSMSAQKANVDAAKKLGGKPEKIADARQLLEAARQNPETAQDPLTYFTAGEVEFKAYDADNMKAQTVPGARVDSVEMGRELINGYHYMLQALPLDSVPNEKGQVKPKYAKKVAQTLSSHINDYFNSGAYFYNLKMFYPEAYEAFYIFGEIPSLDVVKNTKTPVLVTPDFPPLAYFNAGIAAYGANEVEKAADAFRKARLSGSDDSNAYIYEIASLQNLAQRDSLKQAECEELIYQCALAGNEKFGISQSLFLTNVINYLIGHNRGEEALAMLNSEIEKNPESGVLYGLRAYAYDRAENSEASEADYRRAAELPGTDAETLQFAARKLYRAGAEKLNAVEGNSPEAAAARAAIKADYFEKAKAICERALEEKPGDSQTLNVLDSINYALETFF